MASTGQPSTPNPPPLLEPPHKGRSWLFEGTWALWFQKLTNRVYSGLVGPGVSQNDQVALFDGTSGSQLKGAQGTGYVAVTGGVYQTPSPLIVQPQHPPSFVVPDGSTLLLAGPVTIKTGVTLSTAGSGLIRIV
jgi:hypothetical protein